MKQVACRFWMGSAIFLCTLAVSNPMEAQVASDETLPTQVNRSGGVFEITGGSQAGGNLFHSFREFSVPNNNTAFFNNGSDIVNIISRVTGGSTSNINGLIRANGNANLVLINPSGIQFGPNARLNIGGSFLSSTADSLVFEDGTVFSAINPQAQPLLTVSVPVGLQMGANPGSIRVQGSGHGLTVANPIFSPVTRNSSSSGLRVKSGQTLALVGGDLVLDGGVLTAESGRIELGSATAGSVSLQSLPQGWMLGYAGVPSFGNIELRSRALADASGLSGGSIQVQGQNLSVSDGSLLLIQNQGSQPAGNIFVSAANTVAISGTNADGTVRSSLTNETVGSGRGGDVAIAARQLIVQEGGTIAAKTVAPGTGQGGNVYLNISDSVQVIGVSSINPSVTSSIVAATFGAGDAGNNTVSTGRLTASSGGTIAAASFGGGKGGDLNVNATDSIEVISVEPNLFAPSGLINTAFSTGDTGNLTIATPRLTVEDGGRVGTSTSASGSAGSVTINAPELVEVKGRVPGSVNPSLIVSAANLVDPSLQQLFGLPPIPSGASGNVTINTGQLNVVNGAQVTARNQGTGSAGNIRINAGSIFLDNGAGITASTVAGRGGSINLQARESVRASGYSQISNLNGGAEAAGDLTIETGRLVLSDGSFAATTALGQGAGGNLIVRASESVEVVGDGFAEYQQTLEKVLTGGATLAELRNGLFTGTAAAGASGDLTIATQQLNLREGGFIATSTFGTGKGGDLAVRAARKVELSSSGFASTTSGSAQAGNMSIDTSRLLVRDGAAIATSTLGSGAGGNLTINATESVELRNTPVNALTPAGLFTNSIVGTGKAGNLEINTQRLSVREGAAVSTQSGGVTRSQTIASGGVGGDLIINASEAIDLAGTSPDGLFQSVLSTATLGEAPAGNLKLVTGELSVRDGAVVAVSSQGTGNTGSLNVVADSIFLSGGFLSAATAFGQGGSINLRVRDSLQMRGGSQISATAGGTGDGGNIAIDAGNFLVLLERSNLSANAFQGKGGNIQINARGIFICGDCQISASSRLGIDGTVELNTLEPDTKLEVIELPQELANPEEVVALSCQSQRGRAPSEFIITGRGGLPPRPSDPLGSEALVPFEPAAPAAASPPSEETDPAAPPPARGWYVSEKGTVVLSARPSHATPHSSGLPSSECHAN